MKLILTKVSVRAFQRAAHRKLHNQGLNISSLRIYHNILFFNLLIWETKKGKTSEVSQILRTSQLRFNTFDGVERPTCEQVCEQRLSLLLPGDEAAGAPLMGDLLEGHGSSLYSVA